MIGNTVIMMCDAGIWVIHTDAKSGSKILTLFNNYLMTHESVYGSPSLVNEYFWL